MPDEVPTTGTENSSPETTTTETPQLESPQTETPAQETPESTPPETSISAILDAFDQQRAGAPAPTPVALPPKRSYDGLDPDEVPAFKHLRNDYYGALYPKYVAAKKAAAEAADLRKKLDESSATHFYEHENAWTLAPEYQEKSQTVNQLAAEVQFWQNQLERVEAGEQWQPLYQDPQTGKIFAGEPQEPSAQAKAQILTKISQGHTLHAQHSADLSAFEGGFKQKHSNYISELRSIEEKVFGGKENVEKLNKHLPKKLEMFPSYVRNRPEVKLLGQALVLIDGLLAMARAKQATTNGNTIKAATAKSAGPTNAQTGAGTTTGGETQKDLMNKFERAKMGLL